MSELRPSVLDDYGLMAALRWYGKRFSERTGISIGLLGGETISRLPEAVESALFRIAQEALTNVVKHANASKVTLTVEETNALFRLVIDDNGEGFDYVSICNSADRTGLGIMNMHERAQGLGGEVRVISEPKKGTKIVVEMRK
jgi:signal transduction histidine kinase